MVGARPERGVMNPGKNITERDNMKEESKAMTEVIETESDVVVYEDKSEIDVQIATAHRYPRSVANFQKLALAMATANIETAESCFYCLPRKDASGQTKNIEGPSVRLAEIIGSSWGNMRYGAKIVREEKDFIVAQGVAHDLERNVAMSIEVKRRIVNKNGQKYGPDMIAVTANAACAIALRNAIFRVIPKTFTDIIYQQAKRVAVGDATTLSNRRLAAIDYFGKLGVVRDRVLKALGKEGVEDIDLKDLETMTGWKTALTEGDTTIEAIFPEDIMPKRLETPATAAATKATKAAAKKAEPAKEAPREPGEEG